MQKPFSELWTVTRSTSPAKTRSVAAATALRDLGSVGYELAIDELLPYLPHSGGDVDTYRRPRCWNRLRSGVAVRPALEHVEDALRNKPAAHCQNLAIAISMLMAAEQAHRLYQMQVLPAPEV